MADRCLQRAAISLMAPVTRFEHYAAVVLLRINGIASISATSYVAVERFQ
jgi:hypothetical protein